MIMPSVYARAWILMVCLSAVLTGDNEGPALSGRDVVNAADHISGKVAPGEIIVLFPSNAGPTALAGASANLERKIPTLLGETRVLFDGIAAPMAYSVRGQVGAVVPYEIAKRKTTDVVVEYEGVRSSAVTLEVVDSAPAVFTLDLSGKGQAAILNETGCCNSAHNPATRGTLVSLYATGEGQTKPVGITGNFSVYPRIIDYPVPRLPVQVTVGGQPAEIAYAGAAPNAVAGLLQVNFRVPSRAPLGDAVPIVLKVGNSQSADGITMAVRSAVKRVLVINREPAIRNRLGRVLAGAGYQVLTAQDGEEGVRQANEHPVDLVILNLAMPDRESLEAIQASRPQLRIIAIAETLGSATLRDADLLGAQGVLTTAMTSKTVLRRVREALRVKPVAYSAEQAQPIPLNRPIRR
jgi:uncharacterized protein (TIGR03437 family)